MGRSIIEIRTPSFKRSMASVLIFVTVLPPSLMADSSKTERPSGSTDGFTQALSRVENLKTAVAVYNQDASNYVTVLKQSAFSDVDQKLLLRIFTEAGYQALPKAKVVEGKIQFEGVPGALSISSLPQGKLKLEFGSEFIVTSESTFLTDLTSQIRRTLPQSTACALNHSGYSVYSANRPIKKIDGQGSDTSDWELKASARSAR